jgi:hypothetical protein
VCRTNAGIFERDLRPASAWSPKVLGAPPRVGSYTPPAFVPPPPVTEVVIFRTLDVASVVRVKSLCEPRIGSARLGFVNKGGVGVGAQGSADTHQ